MSLQFRIAEQVLKVDDASDATEAIVHKYDAFLNLLSDASYSFQRDAIREVLRFLVSSKYPNLEKLARENWGNRPAIQQRHESIDAYLEKMPLRDRKSVSLDLATGTGKSFVMYGLAAIALAEGLADRVLVLCPSLTIEEGLLEKFSALAGDSDLASILKELGAKVIIPGIKRGNETIQVGDICIENIHAVYERTGASIRDSFGGRGDTTLVLNDEAHHIYRPQDRAASKWLEFLQGEEYGFRQIVSVSGTAYVDDEYFSDVVYRYGLKQAIEAGIVKKPDYKLGDTLSRHDWAKTYTVHEKNRETYGEIVRPISIIVTQEIHRCVEVWRELVKFLAEKEGITEEEAARKAIWVTSGVPSSGAKKAAVDAAFIPRNDGESADKHRKDNLAMLKRVDSADSEIEWIVSVSMLTEGWDVQNVFQIVPHESRAFNSKLLIAQVLGRGLRVPPEFWGRPQPLVTINNHEAWSEQIGNLLQEVLEVENTLSWGFDPRREQFVFPLHNLRYEPEQTTVETKREQAREPAVVFETQDRQTEEISTFKERGRMAVTIDHKNLYEIDDAVRMVCLFLRNKDEAIANAWPKSRIRELIVTGLQEAGYDDTFLSKENLLHLQYSFSPMFRELGREHPRMSQVAKEMEAVDLRSIPRQSFSESTLKDNGTLYVVKDDPEPFSGQEAHLWKQYRTLVRMARDGDPTALAEDKRKIAESIHEVDAESFKTPWNVHFVTYEPERKFSEVLFANSALFDSMVRMPNVGGYSFPYSYKPAKTGKTHTKNENFNPDFFFKVAGESVVLVVEVKMEGDDSNRNRAKYRDGKAHFETLNERLEEAGEEWRYYFYFLDERDFTSFCKQVADRTYPGWKSTLMQELSSSQ